MVAGFDGTGSADRCRLQRIESNHEIVCRIAALSDSYHCPGPIHDARDATGEGRRRSDRLGAGGARRSDMALAVPQNTEQLLRQTVTVPSRAGEIVTQLLWSRLKSRQGVTVLSPSESAKALASSVTAQPPAGQSRAVTVAKQLKADASLIGQVLVYQERVGGRFGASPPATVGFEAKVIAADGQVLWEGNYYEKQRPMIEDMLGFLERWGMFVTAEELAIYGVEHMLLEFPFGTEAER